MTAFTILQWLSSLLFFGVVVLGTVVSAQAFRGYRRSGDATMRYFAIGLGLILVAAPVVGIVREVAHDMLVSAGASATIGILVLEQGIKFLGVCALVYALYAKRRL